MCPDLNPMLNLWAILVREVYCHFRPFDYKKGSIQSLQNLVTSIPDKCIKLIEKRCPTPYSSWHGSSLQAEMIK